MDEFFARNRLSAYLDGELTTDETREVEDALARSAELRAELDALRAAVKLLRVGGPVPAPKGFAMNLEKRLAKEPMQVGWTRHLRRVRVEAVLLAAAAALVIVFIGKKPAEPESAATPEPVAAVGPAAGEPVQGAPPEDADPAELAEPPAVDVAGMPGAENNGVLGDEKLARKKDLSAKPQSFAGSTSKKSKVATEKEAYAPAWEKGGEAVTPPTVQAPARYRLSLTTETGLRDLDAVVRRYGGRLEDERGRPLAPYPMESGDTRRVRLALPAGTVTAAQLYQDLQSLGHAELTQTDTLYAGTGNAPVVIEVSRE